MAANVFRFEETWELPGAGVEDVYDVLSRGELLPLWWKGVYLEAERLDGDGPSKVGDRIRVEARGFLPYRLRFIIEATELTPSRRVVVKTRGDFDGRWTAIISQSDGGAQSGVHVDFIWEVTVLRPILRLLAPLLRPAFAWNPRWTTPRGEKGLKEYLTLRGRQAKSFDGASFQKANVS